MRCIIIAGSPECDIELIKKTVQRTDYVICADKGYFYAVSAGITPDLVVGDFDSYTEKIPRKYETIELSAHKDDTDTMHSIDVAFERGYSDFIILGAVGGRFDHTFANVSALLYISQKGGKGVLLSEKERIELLPVGEYSFDGYNRKTFSLFPFGCERVCVSYSGAEYPLDRYFLKSSVPMGISNVFVSDNSKVSIYDGNAIIIINLSENN